jgi:hypothetical protein
MWSRQLFGNFEKNKNKKSHFEEKSFEIVKIFQRFGQIVFWLSSFEI